MNKNVELHALGYDDWFGERAVAVLRPGWDVARVMTVDRGAFLVRGGSGEATAELSGRYRFEVADVSDLPCVGDWVCVRSASPELAIIHAVLPRKTFLRRKRPGKNMDFQMIAANIDVAFIVQSCRYDFNIRRLDRYLVAAGEGGIEPVVVLSKTDLITQEELDGIIAEIRGAGIPARVLHLSNTTGDGLDEFRGALVPGRTHCLLGSSGVGKTTIINRLIGRDAFDTRAVSGTGEGVHTTARRQLLMLDGGAMLIDTPGMRELGLLGAGDAVEGSIPDIYDRSLRCRFSDCTHTGEPGCAVLAALGAGELDEARYRSYLKLRRETEFHDLSYAEKRKKDKDFGRSIKSFKRQMKRRDE